MLGSFNLSIGPTGANIFGAFRKTHGEGWRISRLGLAKPLSQMGWTPESLESYEAGLANGTVAFLWVLCGSEAQDKTKEEDVCVGSFQINCGPL